MENEQKLELVKNGQYFNLNLKPRPTKGIKGLEDGKSAIVEKVYVEGYRLESQTLKNSKGEPLVSYSCKVLYPNEDGEMTEASFFLSEDEHEVYKEIGGEGDKVKITAKDEIYTDKKGNRRVKTNLIFEKA